MTKKIQYINLEGEVSDKNETLVDVNRASELINQSGEYKQYKKTYQLTDKSISKNIMRQMLKVSHQPPYFDTRNYQEPIFGRNLVEVIFKKQELEVNDYHSLIGSTSHSLYFRYIYDKNHKPLQPLQQQIDILENDTLAFNQALFILLGFNTVLAPDYEIINSTHPIDTVMLNTSQGQRLKAKRFDDNRIATQEFLEFAKRNKFLKELKSINQKTADKNKRKEIVKVALLEFLEQSKHKRKNELITNKDFIKSLKVKGLIIAEIGEDANKRTREPNEVTPKTLYDYLTEIFKSSWWTEQDKSIQDKIKLPKK